MTFLKPLDKSWAHTSWCAPSAFAMLTGCTLKSAHEMFAFRTEEELLKLSSVVIEELLMALGGAGYVCKPVDLHTRYPDHTYGPTIRRYMDDRPLGDERSLPLLIRVPGHVLTGQMDWLGDNWTRRPIPRQLFPKLNRNVHAVWTVRYTGA